MRSSRRLPILILVSGLAAILEGRAGEPERPPAPPKTPDDCRRLVLQELAAFRQLKGPVIHGGDEHLGRAAIRRFHEMQTQARIALAFSGDRDAAAELVQQFDLDQADDDAWARAHSERDHGVYPSWAPTVRLVPAALETSRPELAQKMRQRIIRLWQVEARPTFPDHDPALLDKCSLTELRTIAESDRPLRQEAMRRWARLDPKGATPWLVERINDPREEVNRRFDAAFALAQIGDRRGVDWLKDACVNNVGLGGSPGAALLESGAAGAAAFFQLVEGHDRRQPDKALPYALAEGAGCCSTETLFKHLSRLLQLKDEKARYQVRSAVGWARQGGRGWQRVRGPRAVRPQAPADSRGFGRFAGAWGRTAPSPHRLASPGHTTATFPIRRTPKSVVVSPPARLLVPRRFPLGHGPGALGRGRVAGGAEILLGQALQARPRRPDDQILGVFEQGD